MESIHKKLNRVRKPRVHISYDVETEGATLKKELPFVVGTMGDFSGDATSPLKPAAIVDQVEPLKKLLETRNKLRDLSTKADRSEELESILERVLNNEADLNDLAKAVEAEKEGA